MTRGSAAAGSPLTWLLSVLLIALFGAAITHSAWLWDKQTLWVRGDLGATAFWQTYAATRALYRPSRAAAVRVALLGNSRLWLPARGELVEAELHRLAPERDARVDDLAFFGAKVGDFEAVSRHIDHLQPTLVVIGLSGSDLVSTNWGGLINPTGELFETGGRDPDLPAVGAAARVEQWVKAIWPLYRWRLYVRERLKDALSPDPRAEQAPTAFATPRAYFDFIHGARGAVVEAAYEAWRADPTLDNYVAYLTMSAPVERLNEILPDPATLRADSPGAGVLDRMLARLAAAGVPTVILLLPENPMLERDTDNRFHRPGFAEHAADIVRAVAERHGVRVVDGRAWMPAPLFADFNHVLPGVSRLHTRLAEEILRALGS
jgi:hypothetical protein